MANKELWPNAFVVGAAKAGTNTLHSLLKQHPDIYVPTNRVSLGYFSPDLEYPLRLREEDQYLACFDKAKGEKIRAEVSSLYLASEEAAKKIAEKCPTAKIIITLRNPVEATYAAHNQLVYDGWESETDFGKALSLEEQRASGLTALPKSGVASGNFLYRNIFGKYDNQIEGYWDVFGKDNVLIFLFEDLIGDSPKAAERIYRFLGVDPDFKPQFGVHNPSKFVKYRFLLRTLQKIPPSIENKIRVMMPGKILEMIVSLLKRCVTTYAPRPPMSEDIRKMLRAEYTPMVKRLGSMLDRDLSHWTDK